jgi:hypothetical protein
MGSTFLLFVEQQTLRYCSLFCEFLKGMLSEYELDRVNDTCNFRNVRREVENRIDVIALH